MTILSPLPAKEDTKGEKSENASTATGLVSVKGGLVVQRANGHLEVWNTTSTQSIVEEEGVVIAEDGGESALLAAHRHIRSLFVARMVKDRESEGKAAERVEIWEWKAPALREGSSFLESMGSTKLPM